MKVRVGWPLGTLAAVGLGYVVAVAVVPLERPPVSGEPDAARSARDVEAPTPPAEADAAAAEASPTVNAPEPPPPLRGARVPSDGVIDPVEVDVDLVNLGFCSSEDFEAARTSVRPWYRPADGPAPAVAR